MIEQAIETYLKSYAGLKALIANRLYQDEIPENNKTFPAMAYSIISSIDDHTFSVDPDSTEVSIQYTIAAKTKESRANVDKQLKAAFRDYFGTVDGVDILSALQENRVDSFDSTTGLYLRMVDYTIMYEES
jgi:hypothetical protein